MIVNAIIAQEDCPRMRTSRTSRVALLTALLLASAAPAFADATLFIGANTTPVNRRAQGFAVGAGLLLLGFEFEYAATREVEPEADGSVDLAPALKTGMFNGLIQTPFAIFGLQPYATAGGGIYRERLGVSEETGFVVNTGAGVKVNLAGPLRLRLDYRVLQLTGGALYETAHRVYAGLNLKF
jgi:hypothetical protein